MSKKVTLVITEQEKIQGQEKIIFAEALITIPYFVQNVCYDCIYLFDDASNSPKYIDEKECSMGFERQKINWGKICYHKKSLKKAKEEEMNYLRRITNGQD